MNFFLTISQNACNIISISLSAHKAQAKVQKEVQKMPKVTANYETLFIINATIGEEAIASVVEKFKTLIGQHGEITSVNEWGKRRLAYAIDDMTEGYYVLVEFNSKPEFPAELDRIYKITEEVMRSIIIAKE